MRASGSGPPTRRVTAAVRTTATQTATPAICAAIRSALPPIPGFRLRKAPNRCSPGTIPLRRAVVPSISCQAAVRARSYTYKRTVTSSTSHLRATHRISTRIRWWASRRPIHSLLQWRSRPRLRKPAYRRCDALRCRIRQRRRRRRDVPPRRRHRWVCVDQRALQHGLGHQHRRAGPPHLGGCGHRRGWERRRVSRRHGHGT